MCGKKSELSFICPWARCGRQGSGRAGQGSVEQDRTKQRRERQGKVEQGWIGQGSVGPTLLLCIGKFAAGHGRRVKVRDGWDGTARGPLLYSSERGKAAVGGAASLPCVGRGTWRVQEVYLFSFFLFTSLLPRATTFPVTSFPQA